MLSRKAYLEQFERAPEFVVMFLPSEAFFSTGLEFDPPLFEHAFEQKVLIATPTTLVALLKAVAFGWRQEAVAQNAQEISELGRELYDRIRTLGEHFTDVGDHLAKSVQAYNRAVGSLERRVLPQARRFQTLGAAGSKEVALLDAIDVAPVPLSASELRVVLPASGEVSLRCRPARADLRASPRFLKAGHDETLQLHLVARVVDIDAHEIAVRVVIEDNAFRDLPALHARLLREVDVE